MSGRLAYAIIAVVLISLVIIGGMKFYEGKQLDAGATSYVLEDLRAKHPNADSIKIMDWETKTNEKGEEYLRIRASISEGASTPCPVRIHYYYYYPVQNFVTEPPEYITSGCTVCEGEGCAIAFEEEAIIASHTNYGTSSVHKYVTAYKDAVATVYRDESGWKVDWKSPSSKYGYLVEVDNNGRILSVNTIYY
ncbi:MAG: hypothetical protein QXH30_01135 [Candidatus Bilamarchaeaceae archaeon]